MITALRGGVHQWKIPLPSSQGMTVWHLKVSAFRDICKTNPLHERFNCWCEDICFEDSKWCKDLWLPVSRMVYKACPWKLNKFLCHLWFNLHVTSRSDFISHILPFPTSCMHTEMCICISMIHFSFFWHSPKYHFSFFLHIKKWYFVIWSVWFNWINERQNNRTKKWYKDIFCIWHQISLNLWQMSLFYC